MAMESGVAPRVSLRAILRVKAVESFLRNFHGERERLQELLEIILSYGICCASRNFQLKGITVDELRSATNFDQIKNHDVFVRNSTKPRRVLTPEPPGPHQVFSKPPQDWRVGDEVSNILSANEGDQSNFHTSQYEPPQPDVYFLPNEVHKDSLDEIDFYYGVLGKAFVDMAWSVYSSRGSMNLDPQHLHNLVTRVDQRKRLDLIQPTDFPVCSFVEFLNFYVRSSIKKPSTSLIESAENCRPVDVCDSDNQPKESKPAESARSSSRCSVSLAEPGVRVLEPKRGTRVISSATRSKSPIVPKSLRHVHSKIGPDLQAKKGKILRIQKTQAQIMKESLARTRLAEYSAKESLVPTVSPRQPAIEKRMPLDKITPGAAALEIVEEFVMSPLMDKFSCDAETNAQQQTNADSTYRADSLKEELYGIASRDSSFIGCAVSVNRPGQRKRNSTSTRDYSGWLGDFGAQHTKTIQPFWASDVASDRDSLESGERGEDGAQKSKRVYSSHNDRYAWKFETQEYSASNRPRSKSATRSFLEPCSESSNDADFSSDGGWSGMKSERSDSVYRWLKTAVQ